MKCPADHGNKSELTCFEGKQEKIHGIYELLQQLLKGRPPNKYYLSSRNPETQKPFCTVWLPWPLDQYGKWFTSSEFAKFANECDFEHRTNSPGNSKANGKVESAVKAAKNLIRKTVDSWTDPYIALLDYCNTPTQGMESCLVQCLMNRRTRTLLPTTKALLQPRTPQVDREMKDLAKQQAGHITARWEILCSERRMERHTEETLTTWRKPKRVLTPRRHRV